jgi:NADPH:quinone reductase-like Zn-dependent oxidoreductase
VAVRAHHIEGGFGLDNLRLAERPDAAPGAGEILVRVRAVSLNYRDLLMVKGLYNPKQPLPLVPLSDAVGEVQAVGKGVTRFQTGDRVAASFFQRWTSGRPTRAKLLSALGGPLDGTLREQMVLHEDGLVAVPAHLTDEEAACLPCAGVTAWSALVEQGELRAGDTVVLLGTGGVSLIALQLVKAAGARVILTSSSDAKLERAKALGADETINYKTTPDWEKRVRELTGGEGADHVLEVGGGTLARSVRATRVGGRVALIGNLAGLTTDVNLAPIFMQNIRLQGVLVGSRESFEAMNKAVERHALRPVVDRVFPFADARAAFAWMDGQQHFGKIVISVA